VTGTFALTLDAELICGSLHEMSPELLNAGSLTSGARSRPFLSSWIDAMNRVWLEM
jgi:hypothetical protein